MTVAKRQGQDGFTLLELLIVIIIIAVLGLIIVPGLASGPKRARDVKRKNDLGVVQTALSTYFNDNNSYPGGDYATLGKSLVNVYIPNMPVDPKASQSYSYTPSPTGCSPSGTACASYTLDARLENDKDPQIKAGTTDTYELTSQVIPNTN